MKGDNKIGPRHLAGLNNSLEDPFHQLPFFVAAGGGGAALELGDVGFPFGLAGQSGQAGHVAGPVEVVHGVADHEEGSAEAPDFHRENAHLPLAGNDFRPNMLVDLHVFFNHLRVVYQSERLAISFHFLLIFSSIASG